MKTLTKVLIAVAVLGVGVNAYKSSQPEAVAAREAQDARNAEIRAQNEKIAKENAELRRKEAMELSGEKCTKNGQAIIGESSKRTLKCGWGKPESINRTSTSTHVREQWVYGGRNYLYFVDGVLTTVQN